MAQYYEHRGFQTSCIVSEGRQARPHIVGKGERQCPFCKENITLIEEVRGEVRFEDEWIRIVNNKYPICGGSVEGVHDVVIDTIHHDKELQAYTTKHWVKLLELLQKRWLELAHKQYKLIQIFKNSGVEAGASIPHPHWQIIALKECPLTMQAHYRRVQEAISEGQCPICQEKQYSLLQDEAWELLIPQVPTVAQEVWLKCKTHGYCFSKWTEKDFLMIGQLMQKLFIAYKQLYGKIDYNICLMLGDFETQDDYHDFIKVLPRSGKFAGFELATGCMIHEMDANTFYKQMRKILEEESC